jgi:hypothetical protein
MEIKNATSYSVDIVTLLQLLFIGLKLAGIIDWSWLWVLSPLWFELGVICIVLLLVVLANIIKDY